MNKIKYVLISFVCVLFSLIALWNIFGTAIVENTLKIYAKKTWNSDLNVEKISRHDGVWVLENATLKNQDSNRLLLADKVLISPSWQILDQILSIHIMLDNPKISLGSPETSLVKNSSSNSLNVGSLQIPIFQVNVVLDIPESVLIVHSDAQDEQKIPFKMSGRWNRSDSNQLEASLFDENSLQEQLKIQFKQTNNSSQAILDCQSVPCEKIAQILRLAMPEYASWQVKKGTIQGQISVLKNNLEPLFISGDAKINDLTLLNEVLQVHALLPEVQLSSVLQQNQSKLVFLQPATIAYHSWQIQEIQGQVLFAENDFDVQLDAILQYNEHKFPLLIKGNHLLSSAIPLECSVQCYGKDLINIAPQFLRSGLETRWVNNLFLARVNINKNHSELQLDGTLEMHENNQKNTLNFGFDLANAQNMQNILSFSDWPQVDIGDQALLFPAAWKWKDSTSGLSIKNGWFNAKDISSERFLPFIDKSKNFDVRGFGDLQGTFDDDHLTLDYKFKQASFENKFIHLGVDENDLITAQFFYDVDKGKYRGYMPITNGYFTDKTNGLTFTNIASQIVFDNENIVFSELETFSHGVFFGGDIHINPPKQPLDPLKIRVHSQVMEGKVSQIKKMIAHFHNSPFLSEFPLEGNLSFVKDGGYLLFDIYPGDTKLQVALQGTLSDASLTCTNSHMALKDLGLNFQYDHQLNKLEISDIQGSLILGEANHAEEYTLAGDHIRFSDYANQIAEFDLWIGDKSRDVVRLVGKTQAIEDYNAEQVNYFGLILDQSLSHFGDVHPQSFELILRDWTHVEKFNMTANFDLSTAYHDLQRLIRSNYSLFSKTISQSFEKIKSAQGAFSFSLNYEDSKAIFTYDFKGKNIAIGDYQFALWQLTGKKKGNTWTIDQLQMDNVNIAADISQKDHIWNVNFLGVQIGNSILAGLEGEYKLQEQIFDAKINFLKIDLQHLQEWPFLSKFVAAAHPQGELHTTGTATLHFNQKSPHWDLMADLSTKLKNVQAYNLSITSSKPILSQCSSQNGVFINNTSLTIGDLADARYRTTAAVKKVNYDLLNHEITVDNLAFNIPANNLSWLTSLLQSKFPEEFKTPFPDILKQLKKDEPLEGNLTVARSADHRSMHITFKEGAYYFLDKKYDMKTFVASYDPFEFSINMDILQNNQTQTLILRSRSPELKSGELTFNDNESNLNISWQTNENQKTYLQAIEGSYKGISVKLQNTPSSNATVLGLNGMVNVKTTAAKSLFPSDVLSLINRWGVDGDFTLKGTWEISLANLLNWQQTLRFTGSLEGHNCCFKGYIFDSIISDIDSNMDKVTFKNFYLNDAAGSIEMPLGYLTKQSNEWLIQAPAITGKQLRPLYFRTANSPKNISTESTFIVRKLELNDLAGNLSNLNSFKANGRAYCANPLKREEANSLINVSSDVLVKLGIDGSALCPISGAVDYNIKDGRIYLLKLKEAYSPGKMSKFYFSKNPTDISYVDFDGNLHLRIRMKHYGLLYKLAELFTISIDGTVQNPKHSLLKGGEDD